MPGREGSTTNAAIAARVRQRRQHRAARRGRDAPGRTRADAPAATRDLRAVTARIERAVPGARTASFASTGDRAFVSRDGRTTFVVAYPPARARQLRTEPERRAGRARRARAARRSPAPRCT